MRRIVFIQALVVFLAGASQLLALDINDTLKWLKDALETQDTVVAVEISTTERSALNVTLSNGETITAYPDNLHDEISLIDTEDERKQAVLTHASRLVAAEVLEEIDLAGQTLKLVMPVIRSSESQGRSYPGAIHEHLWKDVFVFFVLDQPDQVRFLERSMVKDAGFSVSKIRALAIENFEDYLHSGVTVESMNSFHVVSVDGYYESSLLLLDTFWSQVQDRYDTPVVAAVPTRDLLIFAESGDRKAVADMTGFIDVIWADLPRKISRDLVVWTGSGWEPYQ